MATEMDLPSMRSELCGACGLVNKHAANCWGLEHDRLNAQMPRRPTFGQICMDLALNLSHRSTCARLRVGTVIASVDHRRILSWGYNGNASGLPNRCDSSEPGKCGCLHSEENAVINCVEPRTEQKIVYVTHSPCVMCAKRLINLGGVVKVIYGEKYRDTAGVDLLANYGLVVQHGA